jgi:hypothetical protein
LEKNTGNIHESQENDFSCWLMSVFVCIGKKMLSFSYKVSPADTFIALDNVWFAW